MPSKYINLLFAGVCIMAFTGLYATQPTEQNLYSKKMDKALSAQSKTITYKPESQLFETWLPWAGKWRNSDKMKYYYNSMENLASDLDQTWDTTANAWANNASDSFGYNSMNMLNIHISGIWSNNTFTNASEITDSFNGNTKTETVFGYNNSSLVPQYRDVYYLDNNGHDTLDINQGWSGSAWVNSIMYRSKFSTAGMVTSIMTSQWTGNQWQITDREQNYYDTEGNDTLYIHDNPAATPGKWVYVFVQQSQNSYNGANQLVQTIQNGSYNNINWSPFTRYDYSYDGNGNDSQYIVRSWDSITKAWINNGRYTLTYSVFTGTRQIDDALPHVKVYPDPAIGRVNFEYYTLVSGNTILKIFDAAGKEINIPFIGFESAGLHTISWDASSYLSPGVYLYSIRSGGNMIPGKFIFR